MLCFNKVYSIFHYETYNFFNNNENERQQRNMMNIDPNSDGFCQTLINSLLCIAKFPPQKSNMLFSKEWNSFYFFHHFSLALFQEAQQ